MRIKNFSFELIAILCSFVISIAINYVYGYTVFHDSIKFTPWDIFGIWDIIIVFLPVYSVYHFFRIIRLTNKKQYMRQIKLEIIQFILTDCIIALIVTLIIWNRRDIKLIEITKLTHFDSPYIFFTMLLNLCIISFVIIQIVNIRKLITINKFIYIRLIPLKIIVLLIFFLFTRGYEDICPWNILEDTRTSESFNVYNIDKIRIGMEKEEVVNLIGSPLVERRKAGDEYWQNWTGDGKSNIGDYAWLEVRIKFYDNKVSDFTIEWVYD